MNRFSNKMKIWMIPVWVIGCSIFCACEKEVRYASATVNGIGYEEVRNFSLTGSNVPVKMFIWEDYHVAEYITHLKPLSDGYPIFCITFYLQLQDNNKLKVGKNYKIGGMEQRLFDEFEFTLSEAVLYLKDTLDKAYDGVAICQESGFEKLFPLKGNFEIQTCDTIPECTDSIYYHGSYELTGKSPAGDTLIIKSDFKAAEVRLTYNL